MLWILFIKVYGIVAAAYLTITGGYIAWRVWHGRRKPHSANR